MNTIPIVISGIDRSVAFYYYCSHVKRVGECYVWTGQIESEGYGRLHWPLNSKNIKVQAHRWAYVLFVGPIPDGLEPDHKCRNRACVNWRHLELVTHKVNTHRGIGPTAMNAAKTHCPKGHPLHGKNLVPWEKDGRTCRTCSREYHREYMRAYRTAMRSSSNAR